MPSLDHQDIHVPRQRSTTTWPHVLAQSTVAELEAAFGTRSYGLFIFAEPRDQRRWRVAGRLHGTIHRSPITQGEANDIGNVPYLQPMPDNGFLHGELRLVRYCVRRAMRAASVQRCRKQDEGPPPRWPGGTLALHAQPTSRGGPTTFMP